MQLSANPHMPKWEGGGGVGGCWTEFKRGGWGGRSVIAGKFMLVVRHHSNNDMELKNIMFLF